MPLAILIPIENQAIDLIAPLEFDRFPMFLANGSWITPPLQGGLHSLTNLF